MYYAEILKANPYHDKLGRFTTHNGNGATSNLYVKYDDPTVTADSILSKFSAADREEIKLRIARANAAPPSISTYFKNGDFTPERKKLHDRIVSGYFTNENVKRATPPPGTKPNMVILGGRGGSGKSAFTDGKLKEFDVNAHLILDSDAIKTKLLPPYTGWNAASVHEEASHIFLRVLAEAKLRKLNVVNDVTLRSLQTESDVKQFKSAGYNIEGHYMFVPRQISAERAVKRYLGNSPTNRGRLVPPVTLLQNTENEKNFDQMKKHFTKWSVYDNQGTKPKLVSRKSKK